MLIVMVKVWYPNIKSFWAWKNSHACSCKIAREKNIDVNKIEGSGKAGRITKEDILKTDSNSTKEKSSVAGNAVVTGERVSKGFLCQDWERELLKG